MMTSLNGNIFRATGHLCGEFTGPRWIPRAWINGWVKNGEAGDLRSHGAHYHVTVMNPRPNGLAKPSSMLEPWWVTWYDNASDMMHCMWPVKID